jgi:hypothetical protein
VAELSQHGDYLSTVEGRVIDDVKQELPYDDLEVRADEFTGWTGSR